MYTFTEKEINPDSFSQGEVWYDTRGTMHKIDEMSLPYVKNTINFIYKKYWRFSPHNSVLMEALKRRRDDIRNKAKEKAL